MRRPLIGLLVSLLGACDATPVPATVVVTVAGAAPLPGIEVMSGRRVVGVTGPDGSVEISLDQPALELRARCPVGWRSESETVRPWRDPARGPTPLTLRCRREGLRAALVVVVPGGEGLVVHEGDRQVARLGPEGVAHVAFERLPGETLSVRIEDDAERRVREDEASASFRLGREDDLFVLVAHLEDREAPRGASRPRPKSRNPGPYRLR